MGKTVTAINLAAALGHERCSTLLIDMDPQGHSSISFGVSEDSRNLYDVFRTEADVRDSILSIKEEGIDILPANINLSKIERDLVTEIDGHFRLRDFLSPIAQDYEFILIDTPPALGMLTVNCLVAADFILIPIQSSYLSLEGTEDLLDTIQKVRLHFNPSLKILGALITIHDRRTVLGQDSVKRIEHLFGDKVFSTIISKSVRLEESPAYRESIFRFSPSSISAKEYRRLGKEVITRVNASRTS